MLFRAALSWLAILALAILNGALRQAFLIPRFGERVGHVASTILLAILVVAAAWVALPFILPLGRHDAWLIGIAWLVLTLAFEFLAGHYLFRTSWEQLLADYNVARGRIWILIPITTLLAPVVVQGWRTSAP